MKIYARAVGNTKRYAKYAVVPEEGLDPEDVKGQHVPVTGTLYLSLTDLDLDEFPETIQLTLDVGSGNSSTKAKKVKKTKK